MRQPLTDSELKKLIMNKWSYSLSWSGDELEIANRFGDEILELITKDRQAYVAQQRQELMEEPVKLLEDALQKFSELWKMWAIDYGIDSNMEKIENYLNKLSKETK